MRAPLLVAVISMYACANDLAPAAPCDGDRRDCDADAQNGCETDVSSDAAHCGACGHRCGEGARCESGVCVCHTGLIHCGEALVPASPPRCVDPNDPSNCGACESTCAGRIFGGERACVHRACEARCDEGRGDCDGDVRNGCERDLRYNAGVDCGVCGRTCAAGEACVAGVCDRPEPVLWRPQSTAIVQTTRPTFAWSLPDGGDAAHLEVCADRTCAIIERTADVAGLSHRFTEPFAAGPHFWRVWSLRAGVRARLPARTWVFSVPNSTPDVDSAWPLIHDGDGDGRADPAPRVEGWSSLSQGWLSREQLGSPSHVGDLDGDGYGDFIGEGVSTAGPVVGRSQERRRFLYVAMGGSAGVARDYAILDSGTYLTGWDVRPIGDFNGDGRADLLVLRVDDSAGASIELSHRLQLWLWGSRTLSLPAAIQCSAFALGDVNSDGLSDFVLDPFTAAPGLTVPGPDPRIYLGTRGPPVGVAPPRCDGARPRLGTQCARIDDVDHDGRLDLDTTTALYRAGEHGYSADRCEVRP